MTTRRYLMDSSYIVSLYDRRSRYHAAALNFAGSIDGAALLPSVALTEILYLIQRNGGLPAGLRFLDTFEDSGIDLVHVEAADVPRVRAIMSAYASAQFDFVDCAIMALAERLNITSICTFDRRDFSIFRPSHCEFLELLP